MSGVRNRLDGVNLLNLNPEVLVLSQLQAHLDETDALDLFQSGFRPCHGTETALVALYDDLLREADSSKISSVSYTHLTLPTKA